MTREPSPSFEDLAGARVGDYEFVGHLARVGAGELYEARNLVSGDRVSVLVLTLLGREVSQRDPGLVDRLRREVLAACAVGHPTLVMYRDFGLLGDGRVYAVTEHLRGETLRHRMERRGPLALSDAARWVDTLMESLAALHATSVVHRSLEPGNVFLERLDGGEDTLRLLGFGIASLLSSDTQIGPQITREGQILGTPLYMAPEQATTSYGGVGPWTDVYALGAMAFHMLTGRPPYGAATAGEILLAHLQAPIPSLRDHRPALSGALDAVIRQALAKRPEGRFATMKAFRRAFRGGLGGSVVLPLVPTLDDGALMAVAGRRTPSPGYPAMGPPPGHGLGTDDTVPPFDGQGAPEGGESRGPLPDAAMAAGNAATVPPFDEVGWAHTLRPEAFAKAPRGAKTPGEVASPSDRGLSSPWARDQDSLTERPPVLDALGDSPLGLGLPNREPGLPKTVEPELCAKVPETRPLARESQVLLWIAVALGLGLVTLAVLVLAYS